MYGYKDTGYEDVWDLNTVKHWYAESIKIAERILQIESDYVNTDRDGQINTEV